MDWTMEYVPGDGLLLAGPDRCVLLLGESRAQTWRPIWPLLSSRADILDLIEALSGHDLAGAAGAAVLVEEPDGPLVLLKGTARAQSDGEQVPARGRYTWAEAQPGGVDVLLHSAEDGLISDGASGADSWLPVVGGVVRCARVRVRRIGAAGSPAGSNRWAGGRGDEAPGAGTEPGVPGADAGPVEPSASPRAERPELPADAESPVPDAREELAAEVPGEDPDEIDAAARVDEGRDELPHEGSDTGVPAGAAVGTDPDQADAAEVGADAGASDANGGGVDDDYDRLFGQTSLMERRPEPAPHVVDDPVPGAPDLQGTGDAAGEVGSADEPDLAADPPAVPADASVAGLIDAVPGLIDQVPGSVGTAAEPDAGSLPVAPRPDWPPFQATAPAPSSSPATGPQEQAGPGASDHLGDVGGGAGDHDGRTVLRPSRKRGAQAGETVRAIVCPEGHANPPEAVACRTCGTDIGDVPIETIARPVMGVLRPMGGGTGPEIHLDRTMVLGRKPRADSPGASVRLVQLDDPDGELSRNHVRVTLEGWHVLITDLGSTNGTVLEVPGHPPVRLRRGEATPISPGAVLVLADTLRFRFEVP